MRDLTTLDRYRINSPLFRGADRARYGAFYVPVGKRIFLVLASVDYDTEQGIEHISVSHRNEKIVPSWDEMCKIKDMFFLPEEECVEIHPKKSKHINIKDNCLHIWRPVNGVILGRPWKEPEEFWKNPEERTAKNVYCFMLDRIINAPTAIHRNSSIVLNIPVLDDILNGGQTE